VNEPTNWRTWATLSRLEARAGDVTAALADFRKARSLDPRSLIFNG
jgi:cytochrome c-type biogenesis protein CcmH/NrfG